MKKRTNRKPIGFDKISKIVDEIQKYNTPLAYRITNQALKAKTKELSGIIGFAKEELKRLKKENEQ